MRATVVVGYTLSQVALSARLGRAASWLRSQGDFVTAVAFNGDKETWARMEYSSHRCAGYKLVTIDPAYHQRIVMAKSAEALRNDTY